MSTSANLNILIIADTVRQVTGMLFGR